MGHSYLDFENRQLHLRDTDIVLFTSLLRRFAPYCDPPLPPRLLEMYAAWDHAFIGSGCIDLRLAEFLNSEETIEAFVRELDATFRRIRLWGTTIPAADVNAMHGMFIYDFGDVPIADIATVLRKVRRLLRP